MKTKILETLNKLEKQKNITILFACESGSRAWGFPSSDSDYDVRFIYTYAAKDYLSIDHFPDVIEYTDGNLLDINGWDIKKALHLYRKSNSALYEWIQSPIIYAQKGMLQNELMKQKNMFYEIKAGMHHYLSIARSMASTSLNNQEVRLKKFFYVLRSLLAAEYIVQYSECPPMQFSELRELISESSIQRDLDVLLDIKKSSTEADTFPIPDALRNLVHLKIETLSPFNSTGDRQLKNAEVLNTIFRNTLYEV